MNARSSHNMEDRILLSRTRQSTAALPQAQRRSYLWTIVGGVLGSTILLWMMVQLGQASPDSKGKPPESPADSAKQAAAQPGDESEVPVAELEDSDKPLTPPSAAAQGPALDTPREVIEMLDLRKRDLDRREEAVRQNEQRLLIVKAEIEQLLTRNEAIEKRRQAAREKNMQEGNDEASKEAKAKAERERQAQQQKNQLAKMYESMPSEEAAARLERMPDRKAIEILRLVKAKTAGSILAQVQADRAAKLTEQLLAQTQ